MNSQREAYLSFATGYLWASLTQIRNSGMLVGEILDQLDVASEFIRPILNKLYQEDPVPNRFLLFTDNELKSLLASLFSNDKIWRTLIQNELDTREQQRSSPTTHG